MMTNATPGQPRTMIAAVFFLLICSAASGLWLAWQKQEAERWVRHTFEVSDRLAQVRILNLRAEVYRRTYLLTGRPEDRAQVGALRQAVTQALDDLRRINTSNPEQGVRVARLAALSELPAAISKSPCSVTPTALRQVMNSAEFTCT